MALKIGNNAVANAFVGSSQVRRAYKGGTLVYQGFGPAAEQEFIEQTAAGGPAQLLKVYGKSIVWNQQVQPFAKSERTSQGATFSITNGVLTIVCPGGTTSDVLTASYISEDDLGFRQQEGHLYYSPNTLPQGLRFARNVYGNGITLCSDSIQTGRDSSTTQQQWSLVSVSGTIISQAVSCPIRVIDLTLLYGAGNEPTTVAQFLADYPEYDPTYDPGSLQSNKTAELRAERIPVINVWDEEWEVGSYNAQGTKLDGGTRIRSKNPIPVSPNTPYYYKMGVIFVILFLDADKRAFGGLTTKNNDQVINTPSDARYVVFYTAGTYGDTYNHDICINLSDPAINGQYFPHWRGKLTLNLSTLTGKLNGEGASVVVYPDGLRGVGTDRDAASGSTGVVARAVVDLGGLTWYYTTSSSLGAHFYAILSPAAKNDNRGVLPLCAKYQGVTASSRYYIVEDKVIAIEDGNRVRIWDSAYTDPATFKAAMSGVMLDYPLATPLTYTLDTPLPTDLTCEQGDILQRVSDNNCPFVGEMKFGL